MRLQISYQGVRFLTFLLKTVYLGSNPSTGAIWFLGEVVGRNPTNPQCKSERNLQILPCSSKAERSAVNRVVVGSNPIGAAIYPFSSMDRIRCFYRHDVGSIPTKGARRDGRAWLIATVLKTVDRESGPWVRIPVPPPSFRNDGFYVELLE